MKNNRVLLVLVLLSAFVALKQWPDGEPGGAVAPPAAHPDRSAKRADAPSTRAGDNAIAEAFRNQRSDVPVSGAGIVTRLLADDLDGSPHQRFLLGLPGGQTVLVAHNIGLAPRIGGIQVGDRVEFAGEYVWNTKGGLLHWTHRDPRGSHRDGWLRHAGRTYQ